MVKKRRIHADVPLQEFKTSLTILLLHRELGRGIGSTAAAAAWRRSRRDAKQQLVESTLHLIDLQARPLAL
jgi:hypothetical protein